MLMIQKDRKFVSYIESRIQDNNELYARFNLGTFVGGQALTIANALRRTLLSELPGFVITGVQINGVTHEFATLPGVHENILNIILNLKRLVLINKNPNFETTSSLSHKFKAFIDVVGPGSITAADIKLPPHLSVVSPEHHIATLSSNSEFQCTLTIQYIEPLQVINQNQDTSEKSIEELSIITSPKPVQKANFGIHQIPTLDSQEYISFEIWTNGSITPKNALDYALEKLTRMFYDFTILNKKNSITFL